MAVGASVSYSIFTEKYNKDQNGQEIENLEMLIPQYGFSVFGRYQLFRMEKFAMLAECAMNIGSGSRKETSGLTTEKQSVSSLGINVFPVITYDLTERINLITTCDFLRLGFNSYTFKDKDRKITSNEFGFSTQSTVFSYLSDRTARDGIK